MKHLITLFLNFTAFVILISCNSKIATSLSKSYPPLHYSEEVVIIGLDEPIPDNAEEIGTVKIGDSGFSTNCDYYTVLENAKIEARKAGGNAIKIMIHKKPSPLGSTCHRIEALILKITKYENIVALETREEEQYGTDFALFHIYRFPEAGSKSNYDLYLVNDLLCKVSNNFKTTIPIKKDGYNSIWAKTKSNCEIPINVKFGKEYYLRCGVTIEGGIERPTVELIDIKSGKSEFDSHNIKLNLKE